MKNLCPVEAFPPACFYVITQIKHKKKALLEAAFAEVSNTAFYYKLMYKFTNSCYRTNMPGKTNHLFTAICFPYSLFIFPGNTDILQILCALRSNGSAARGNPQSGANTDNVIDLSLGQEGLFS